jgi:hypothetical protein
MRLRVIACEVIARELYHVAAAAPGVVDIHFLTQGLHDIGPEPMKARLQEEVDRTDAKLYDAVALGYALCSNGTDGICARDIPVVLPRAHDCITLLLGSRQRYKQEFEAVPGTYYGSAGWYERDHENLSHPGLGAAGGLGKRYKYEEYVEAYGEENAKYIMEQLEGGLRHYERLLFVRTGLGGEDDAIACARRRADEEGWRFETADGDLALLRKLVSRQWDEDFVVLRPGESIKPTHNDTIVDCATCPSS